MGRLSTIQPVPTTDEPWRVTAVAPGPRGRWSKCTDHHRTYLEALGQAKRLAWEARRGSHPLRQVLSSSHRGVRRRRRRGGPLRPDPHLADQGGGVP